MRFVYIFITILIGRLGSSLLGYEFLNTDEFVIGSKALRIAFNNFDFFEFDGDTSGVLNALFLTWPFFFNVDITYFSIRVSAAFITSLTLYFLLKTIEKNIKNIQSIFVFVPILLFYTFSIDPDFLHYANELIATLLFTIALYLTFTKKNSFYKRIKAFVISLLCGSILFSKMQFFPVSVFFVFILAFREFFYLKDFKTFFVYVLGFSLPTLLFSIYYYNNQNFLDLFYNVIHYPFSDLFYRNMNHEDIIYSSNNLLKIIETEKLSTLVSHLLYNSVFHLFYFYLCVFVAVLFLVDKKIIIKKIKDFNLFLISTTIILTILIIIGTGSVHRHYLIFILPMIPVFLSIFIRLAELKNKKLKILNYIAIFFIVLFSFSLLFENKKFYKDNFIKVEFDMSKINFYSPRILEYLELNSGDKAVVWGWKPEIYLLSNLQPATRETVNQKQIDFKSNREYFRNRFLKDFKNNLPAVVLDYVKPKGDFFKEDKYTLKSFAEIKQILDNNYETLNKNSFCPDLYLLRKNYNKLKNNLVNYSINKKMIEAKINDYSIDEKLCDTSFRFKKSDNEKKFYLTIEGNRKANEMMILAANSNNKKSKINFLVNYENNKIEKKTLVLNQYPFWSKILFNDKNVKIIDIQFDVSDLISNNFGINELKMFNNKN